MDPAAIGVLVVAVILALDKFGLLERYGLIVRSKSVGDFEAELKLADRKLLRLEAEKAAAELKAQGLEQTRSIEPVLTLVSKVLDRIDASQHTQAETLDKLASFNGSLKHVEQGLRDTVGGMQALLGVIAELHDIPLTPPQKET